MIGAGSAMASELLGSSAADDVSMVTRCIAA
jgi:hypothetical protein